MFCHSCLALSFQVHFLLTAVLFTINSLSHFPVLNIALQCFIDHSVCLKQLFPLTFKPLTYKSENGNQNKRSLLLLWSRWLATLYRYSAAPVTNVASFRAMPEMFSQH